MKMEFTGSKEDGPNNEIVTKIIIDKEILRVITTDAKMDNTLRAEFKDEATAQQIFCALVAAYPALREDDYYEDDEFNKLLKDYEFQEV